MGMNNPCAQVPLFSGMDAMCHPDQCTASSTDGTPVIQLILDEDYASFTDSDLEDLIDRLQAIAAQMYGANVRVEIVDVRPAVPSVAARFQANYQTVVTYQVRGLSNSQLDDLSAEMRTSNLGFTVIDARVPGVTTSPLPDDTPTTVPVPVPANVPVLVPVTVNVPNPVPNPIPVPVNVPNPIPVPVPVPVPVAVADGDDDDSSASFASLSAGLIVILALL